MGDTKWRERLQLSAARCRKDRGQIGLTLAALSYRLGICSGEIDIRQGGGGVFLPAWTYGDQAWIARIAPKCPPCRRDVPWIG